LSSPPKPDKWISSWVVPVEEPKRQPRHQSRRDNTADVYDFQRTPELLQDESDFVFIPLTGEKYERWLRANRGKDREEPHGGNYRAGKGCAHD
jgi:hypothetical protein